MSRRSERANALIGDDYSITNAMLIIITMVVLDISLSLVKLRSPWVEGWLEGA